MHTCGHGWGGAGVRMQVHERAQTPGEAWWAGGVRMQGSGDAHRNSQQGPTCFRHPDPSKAHGASPAAPTPPYTEWISVASPEALSLWHPMSTTTTGSQPLGADENEEWPWRGPEPGLVAGPGACAGYREGRSWLSSSLRAYAAYSAHHAGTWGGVSAGRDKVSQACSLHDALYRVMLELIAN